MKLFTRAGLVAAALIVVSPVAAATTLTLNANNKASFSAEHDSNPDGSSVSFTDEYDFTTAIAGNAAAAAIEISVDSVDYLDLTSATLNGTTASFVMSTTADGGLQYVASVLAATNQAPTLNTLFISGSTVGAGGVYNGNISVKAATVPEPASWAMMVGGFGLLGGALRRKRTTAVSFG